MQPQQTALEFDPAAGLSSFEDHAEYPSAYASSSGSFSTASTVSEAFTPPGSGRSTPKKRTPSAGMEFDMPVVGYQTPPASAGMPSYFPGSSSSSTTSSHHAAAAAHHQAHHPQQTPAHGLKTEYTPHPMLDCGPEANMVVSTPSRKDVDFDQPSAYQPATTTFQPPQQHMFPQYNYANSFQGTTPYVAPGSGGSFSLDGSTPEVPSSWSCFDDGSVTGGVHGFAFDQTSMLSPTSSLPSSRHPHHPHHAKHSIYAGDAQLKTNALRHAQYGAADGMPLRSSNGGNLRKSRSLGSNGGSGATGTTVIDGFSVSAVIERGTHQCDFPGCNSRPFKRQEHLKRHKDTKHNLNGGNKIKCEYCEHVFNRRDNYRQHLHLHVKNKDKPQARTKWHPGAKPAWDLETSNTKTRSRPSGSGSSSGGGGGGRGDSISENNSERSSSVVSSRGLGGVGATPSSTPGSGRRGAEERSHYRRMQHHLRDDEAQYGHDSHQQQLPLPTELPSHHLASVLQPHSHQQQHQQQHPHHQHHHQSQQHHSLVEVSM